MPSYNMGQIKIGSGGNGSGYYSTEQEMANAKKIAQMYSDAINTQYAAGIANLQSQQANISESYDPYRVDANLQGAKSQQTLKENMANLNLDRSGTNLTAQTQINTATQRNLNDINAQEAKAARDLQAQINEYIAQRDGAIATQTASTYENAYNNISSFNQQMEGLATQHGYDKEMAAIQNGYDKEMAALDQQYKIAYMEADYAQQSQIQQQMAATEYQYSRQLAAYESQLSQQEYAGKSATDWGYYQQQAALDKQNDIDLYNSKAATDWGYYQKQAALATKGSSSSSSSSSGSSSTVNDALTSARQSGTMTADALTPLARDFNETFRRYRTMSNPDDRQNYEVALTLRIMQAYENGQINDKEFKYLVKTWDL